MQQASLKTAGGSLPYTIMRRPRVKRRLHLERAADGGLVVVAPAHWSEKFIHQTMQRNLHRVEKFLATPRGRPPSPLQYVNGEKHWYLGHGYRLVLHNAGRNRVAISAGEIHVWARNCGKTALHNWYRHEAGALFQARLEVLTRRAPWTHGKRVPLQQRRMKRTWGNCSSSGLIKLNTQLVKAPVKIIDSVIAHELCHLEEMNHSAAFYALLEQLNPGWRQDRACLRAQGPDYLRT